MKLWIAVGLLLALAGSASAQGPLASRPDHVVLRHDALRYEVSLTLPDTGTRISATVAIRWRLGGPGPIVVDLDDAHTVRAASIGGRPVKWRRIGDQIEIPVSGKPGTEVTTSLSYDGSPIDGLLLRGTGPTRTVFADNWPDRAHLWLASQDYPADKAAVGWSIDAPGEYQVVATGVLRGVDTLAGGRRRWRFENAEPVPVYTMVVGMARLAMTRLADACAERCVPVSVWTYPEDSAFAVSGPFRRAGEILAFFSKRIGPFPYGELRHVESSTRFGGMENSTAIFYDEKAYQTRRTQEGTVAHETMHQWFGDAVTEGDWHHVWLSEGFATYGAALWTEHAYGDSALRREMAQDKAAIIRSKVTERPMLDSTITKRLDLLNTNSYQKGGWVLHSLRGLVGDSAFFRGLSRYYALYKHKKALSADFARVMAAAAGMDLSWFFRQALTQPGYPILEIAAEVDGGHLVLTLRQVQKPAWGVYRMPNLRVRLDDRIITVPVTGRVTRMVTHWESDKPPSVVEVDPDGWWLVEARRGQREQ